MHQPFADKSVMLADDNDACRDSVAAFLGQLGYTVTIAADGLQAMELLRESDYSVMIFDLRMPGLSGMEVIERLRRYDRDGSVIVMTGYPAVDSAILGLQKGVCDYIIKPVDMERLGPAVESAYERCCQRRRTRRRESQSGQGRKNSLAVGGSGKQEHIGSTDKARTSEYRGDTG